MSLHSFTNFAANKVMSTYVRWMLAEDYDIECLFMLNNWRTLGEEESESLF
jgi:hypothetical protein